MRLSYTLLADGTSDRSLMRVIAWTLREQGVAIERESWADSSVQPGKRKTLEDRVEAALRLFPCDILFVHRDAENKPADKRIAEISNALGKHPNPFVPIIPVRMTEAWFLHDEQAIRQACGNPNGKVKLNLPAPAKVEQLVNPKTTLFDALLRATELEGRRREKKEKQLPRMRARVAELIDGFSPLANVPAFKRFSNDVRQALQTIRAMEVVS